MHNAERFIGMNEMRHTKLTSANKLIFLFIAIALSICLCFWCFFIFPFQLYETLDKPSAEEGQQKANDLIIAIEQYKNDTGNYPSDLTLLVPKYLLAIPKPAWNAQYEYKLQSNGNEFIIYFDVGLSFDGDYCEYSSRTRSWYCSDKI